jgi:hypothetical protein
VIPPPRWLRCSWSCNCSGSPSARLRARPAGGVLRLLRAPPGALVLRPPGAAGAGRSPCREAPSAAAHRRAAGSLPVRRGDAGGRRAPGTPLRARSSGPAVLLLATTGAFSVLTVVALPDAPLVAAWTWALCFLAEALLDGRGRRVAAGRAVAGLAFDSKYSAAFLLLGAGLLLLRFPRAARARLPGPGSACSPRRSRRPVWIWNAEHDWARSSTRPPDRVEHARGPIAWNLLGLVGSQLVLVLPASGLGLGTRGSARHPEDASAHAGAGGAVPRRLFPRPGGGAAGGEPPGRW